jgi:hypothetical protein
MLSFGRDEFCVARVLAPVLERAVGLFHKFEVLRAGFEELGEAAGSIK